MKTKPEPKICVICTNAIVAPDAFRAAPYHHEGKIKNGFVHEWCAWMEGVKSLVRALHANLVEQRQRKTAPQR